LTLERVMEQKTSRHDAKEGKNELIALVVAWKRGQGYEFGKVKTTTKFTGRLLEAIRTIEQALGNRERKDYSIGDEIEDDEYMVKPLLQKTEPAISVRPNETGTAKNPQRSKADKTWSNAENPVEFRKRLVSTMGSSDPVGFDFLREKDTKFYALVQGVDNKDRTAYIRHHNPMLLTKPGHILASLGDTLDSIVDPVFAMDERADIIMRPNEIVIINKKFFDSLFFDFSNDGSELDSIAIESLKMLPFQDETLKMLIGHMRSKKRMRRKMLEIRESNHLANVTIQDFKDAVKKHGRPERKFLCGDAICVAEEDIEVLFDILNEDLYNGALTDRALAATRKRVKDI
jgi:hypothetical protein